MILVVYRTNAVSAFVSLGQIMVQIIVQNGGTLMSQRKMSLSTNADGTIADGTKYSTKPSTKFET